MEIDWDESRRTALRLSSILMGNVQQTAGRSCTVGNLSLTVPTTRTPELDHVHHLCAQKMLDFLTTDQFDADSVLRSEALEAAVNNRTASNLTHMLANHSFVTNFRTQEQNAYRQEVNKMQNELKDLKQKHANKPNNHTKDSIRVLTLKLTRAHKTNSVTVPYNLVSQVWEDMANDTILAAEKLVSVGALFVRASEDSLKTQCSLSRDDILQHRAPTQPTTSKRSPTL